jgi:hypothetical protein
MKPRYITAMSHADNPRGRVQLGFGEGSPAFQSLDRIARADLRPQVFPVDLRVKRSEPEFGEPMLARQFLNDPDVKIRPAAPWPAPCVQSTTISAAAEHVGAFPQESGNPRAMP